MMNTLDEKIQVDNTFIDDLISKGWQESDNIKSQLENIKMDSDLAHTAAAALKNLLTAYYIFTGCLENIRTSTASCEIQTEIDTTMSKDYKDDKDLTINEEVLELQKDSSTEKISEPFEYLVDFDIPIGEPITDADLYSN